MPIGLDENLTRHEGEAFGAYHSYGEEKVVAFTEYINFVLDGEPQVSALQTATHCNKLQRTARHCNALQRTATHCKTLQHTAKKRSWHLPSI